MDDLLSEFLTETNESLGSLDTELVQLEQNPNDPALLANIFRLMHTIKGTCGFLGLPRLESVAHAGENIMSKFRDGELEVSPQAVSLILECLDKVREILGELEQREGEEPEGDDSDLIARLNAFAEGGAAPAAAAEPEPEPDVAPEPEPEPVMEAEPEAALPELSIGEVQAAVEEAFTEPEPAAAPQVAAEPEAKPAPKPKEAAKPAAEAPAKAGGGATHESSVANQSIRVSVEVLENLMTMVSELVLTRNQLLQTLRQEKESPFTVPLQRLNHVVSELQEGVMQTRMQPIGNAWAKLPRIIRDLSLELNKKIDLVMKGQDTELDRQVLDLIKDPLTHMVRNSADHGLERPEERLAAGKSEVGTVLLNAFHEGGHIIIEIKDDGRGLNIERIKEKALANGVTTEAELAGLSEQQVMQFIFKPGFSTAEQVTSVSGRGVGMDVVRTNIEKIGGTIELTSTAGKGSQFTIKIPLTLAIVSALIVECGGQRFAIPQLSVVELVRASSNSEHTIERISGTPVLRLRDRLLPLVGLRRLLRLEDGSEASEDEAGHGFIVVSQVGTYSFGIIVDRVFDTEEIVVKPVAKILRDLPLYSGNTILGDGSVVMILDPNGIAAATGEISVPQAENEAEDASAAKGMERIAMLLFKAGGAAPKAVPLSLVARLEEIEKERIEVSDGTLVVQYRGHLMPLLSLEGQEAKEPEERQPVLVFADGDKSMGLMVDEIVDIVEDRMAVELGRGKKGYLGSAIIGGKATDVLDAGYYLSRAFADWFGGETGGVSFGAAQNRRRLLLVDDSPFFRNLLAPLLGVAGYEVEAVDSAERALELCEAGESFDCIISDIEMPGMSGFDLAETLKQGSRWSRTPIVALSSHATPQDLARGHSVGFNDYVPKFDRDSLLAALQETLEGVRGAA